MSYKIKVMCFVIGAIAIVGCIAMSLAFTRAVGEIQELRGEVNYYKNKPPKIMFPMENEVSDEEAFLKVLESFAELQSANITIDTPDAHIHIEWQR